MHPLALIPCHLGAVTARLGEYPIRTLIPICFLAAVCYRVLRYLTAWRVLGRAYASHGCERPAAYRHKDPVLGLDALFDAIAAARESRFTTSSARLFREIGANTYFTWIQGQQTIHTAEPDNIKCMLATQWRDYSIATRQAVLGEFLGHGIFVLEGDDWARSRARLRPNFAKDQVADLAMLERHVAELLRVLPSDPSDVVDLQTYFLRFTLDSASEFLLGHSTNTLARPSARDQEFGEAFTSSLLNITQKLRRGPLDRFYRKHPREKGWRRICRDYIGTFVDEAMTIREKMETCGLDEAEGGVERRYYFLKEVAKTIDNREHICDEIMNLMVAGRDTTASLMSSAFYVLSRRPDLWRMLRHEIQDLGSKPPNYEQLRGLKFAKYIINETLRLYPPVFQNNRQATRDTILPTGGGPDGTSPVFVPKGSSVVYSAWTMQRRKDLYGPDADEFRPERWATQRHGWDFIPFGGGPRICIGQQYALTEATYVMVRMAQEYVSVGATDDAPWTEYIALTLSVKEGVKCRLTRASS
ncbi:hypothetical protein V2A60_010274 [Cordyceps javanica]|uniref:Cytochrome P450 n=1 Tax=Cordyceps javanica TaxID=43265 RepID=A0A545UV19_9HYPO|nr:Cytochrome P450 [Cordyceps javanica]TQW05347.1 Cytochrome P450 [Cordyceps javanica]